MTQLVQQKTTGKTVKLLAVLAALGLALTACAGGGEKTETVFTTNQNGVDITMTYYATGDEVTSQSTESVISYEALGVEDQDSAEEMLAPMAEEFKDIEGVEHEIEYGEDSATERLSVDYTTASLSEVARLTGSTFDEEAEDGGKVGLEQSRKMLADAGFTEVESKVVE
ncbi:YehR family protein [Leucobacter sp. GX24907]